MVSFNCTAISEIYTQQRQETAADGSVTEVTSFVLTPNGVAQQRRDRAWGGVLAVGGLVTLGWACAGLIAPRRVLAADEEGLTLWLDGRRRAPLRLAWEEVAEIRSGLRQDEAGEVAVMSLRVHDSQLLPLRPVGGVVEPPWLHVFAGEWDQPARDVVAVLEGYVTGFRGWEAYG